MYRSHYIVYFSIIALAVLFFSCALDNTCMQNTNVRMVCGMYTKTKSVQTGKNDSILTTTPDLISVRGIQYDSTHKSWIGMDTSTICWNSSIANFKLPLHVFAGSSTFIISNKKTSVKDSTTIAHTDTLTVFHSNSNHLLSLECGSVKFFTIDSIKYTKNGIDSIKQPNNLVTNINAENIKIYRHR